MARCLWGEGKNIPGSGRGLLHPSRYYMVSQHLGLGIRLLAVYSCAALGLGLHGVCHQTILIYIGGAGAVGLTTQFN